MATDTRFVSAEITRLNEVRRDFFNKTLKLRKTLLGFAIFLILVVYGMFIWGYKEIDRLTDGIDVIVTFALYSLPNFVLLSCIIIFVSYLNRADRQLLFYDQSIMLMSSLADGFDTDKLSEIAKNAERNEILSPSKKTDIPVAELLKSIGELRKSGA